MISYISGGLQDHHTIWILLLVHTNVEVFLVNPANALRVESTAYLSVAANGNVHGNNIQTAVIKR